MTALATTEIRPPSVLEAMATRYGMVPNAFEATVRATCMPGNVSKEQFAAFLLVAKEYGLNPLTKELFAFPSKGGGIQPIVSIDGWMRMINDHPACDGVEFEDHIVDGKLDAITCRIYRKDRTRPTLVTEYMAECRRNTDVWRQWPSRMLRHKAAIQCARYAFGFSGIMDPDEWERAQSVNLTQPAGLRARLEASRTAPSEGFTVAHSSPVQADVVEVDADTGELLDAAHEAEIAQEALSAPDGDGFADEFSDPLVEALAPVDPNSPEGIIADFKALLNEAETLEAVDKAKAQMAPLLNGLDGGNKARARDLIADARQRIGG